MARKSQFTEEQIIRAIKEQESGTKAEEVARRLGVTTTTFFAGSRSTPGWKSATRGG
jgi:transposase-like protein